MVQYDILIMCVLMLSGRLYRFHGVRRCSEFGSEGRRSAEAALVLQTFRHGRQRMHRPRRAAADLQGVIFYSVSLRRHLLVSLNVCSLSSFVFLLQAVQAINGLEQEISAEDLADMVFNKIDVNGDGNLFIHLCYLNM